MWDYCSVCENQGRRGVRRNSYCNARSMERGGKSAPDDVVIVVTEWVDVAAPPFQGWGLNWSQLVPSAWDYLGVCTVLSEILSMGACY